MMIRQRQQAHRDYLQNTSLLIRGQAGLQDISPTRLTMTASGSPTNSTTTKVFGKESLYFDGSSYLEIADNAAWDFGTGEFTIDWWEHRTVTTNYRCAFSTYRAYTPFLLGYRAADARLVIYITANGAAWGIASAKLLAAAGTYMDAWHHYRVTRSGSNFYSFQDGVQQDTWSSALGIYNGTEPMRIGYCQTAANGGYFGGYVQNVRFIKGLCLSTGNFTPPVRDII